MNQWAVLDAGAVLVAPFLPQLFSVNDLVDHRRFVDRRAQAEAVSLVAYLLHDANSPALEPHHVSRVLCGIGPGDDVEFTRVRDKQAETAEELLRAVVEQWSAIGRTSITELRETFLRREGQLTHDDGWWLQVSRRPYDMLLDRVPWTFSIVQLPWMLEALRVDWR